MAVMMMARLIKYLFMLGVIGVSKSHAINDAMIFRVGGTYDTMSKHPTPTLTCLRAALNTNNIMISSPQGLINFNSQIDSESVRHALGIDVTASYGWGAFAVQTSYKYAHSSQNDDFTLNLNYAYKVAGEATFKPNSLLPGSSSLTDEAQQLLDRKPAQFRTLCGNRFISELSAGVTILMRVSLKFSSRSEKDHFENSFHGIQGLANVLSIIKQNPENIAYDLNLAGIQVGGDPEYFNRLFLNYGGILNSDGYPILSCNNAKDKLKHNCTDLINKVISYANLVSNQLTSPIKYYFTNPKYQSWPSIGVFPGEIEPDQEALAAMHGLFQKYADDLANLEFIQYYLTFLNTTKLNLSSLKENIIRLANSYQLILNYYQNPKHGFANCYNGFVTRKCIAIYQNLLQYRQNILKDDQLNWLLDYLKSNQYSISLRASVAQAAPKVSCDLIPVSSENQHIYLVNCRGQISGYLNYESALTITRIPQLNGLAINNLTYYYKLNSIINHFRYVDTHLLLPDIYYSDTWRATVGIIGNDAYLGTSELKVVKRKIIVKSNFTEFGKGIYDENTKNAKTLNNYSADRSFYY